MLYIVDAQLYTLHPFFLRYIDISHASSLPVYSSIQALLPSLSFPTTFFKVSSHIFRTTVITNILRNPHTSFIEPLEARQWRRFWAEPILPQVRNLWYRALHQSLSCKVNLHAILPHLHPSNLCTLCNSNSPDTLLHFLYTCPIKWDIWCFLWSSLFLFTPTTADVHSAIFSLSFPHIQSRVSSHTIVACILHGIWSAHWRFIFDAVPFDRDIISQNIHYLLSQSYSLTTYEPP
ncbi:hypothetical protein BDC45DRAFT_509018 [Circinella umbellata]|nr:hypothetical protein BDC45DRAFT_509018 [Circinella umbellata]